MSTTGNKNKQPFKSKLPKFTFLKRTPKKPKSNVSPTCKKDKEIANLAISVEKPNRRNSMVSNPASSHNNETKIPVLSAKSKESTTIHHER